MPQIWLTYEELAVLLDCDASHARATASAIGLDRRKSRDGTTRAKLTATLAAAFLDGMLQQRIEQQMAANASALRAMHERMKAHAPPLQLPSVIAS